jgi:hypothetical protein
MRLVRRPARAPLLDQSESGIGTAPVLRQARVGMSAVTWRCTACRVHADVGRCHRSGRCQGLARGADLPSRELEPCPAAMATGESAERDAYLVGNVGVVRRAEVRRSHLDMPRGRVAATPPGRDRVATRRRTRPSAGSPGGATCRIGCRIARSLTASKAGWTSTQRLDLPHDTPGCRCNPRSRAPARSRFRGPGSSLRAVPVRIRQLYP